MARPEAKPLSAEQKRKVLDLARARFKESSDFWSDLIEQCAEDERFAFGNDENEYQWPAEMRKSNSVRLTVNRLSQHIRQVTNEQRQNRPAIKVRPVDDQADPKTAEVINGIIRHIHHNTNDCYEGADVALSQACDNQVTSGIGYFEICADYYDESYNQQDLYFRRIHEWKSIYDDAAIRTVTGRDRRYLFETYVLPEAEFEAEYPDAEAIDWDAERRSDTAGTWFSESKGVRVAKYWTCEKGSKKKKVRCYTITGHDVLEVYEWPGQYIPFVRIVGNHAVIDGKPFISGLIRNAKDPQRLYNYWKSREAEALANQSRAPWVGPARAFKGLEDVWNKSNAEALPWLPYNDIDAETGQPVQPPTRMQPPLPEAGFLQAAAMAAQDIQASMGQYDASLGRKSNEQSGVAIRQRESQSDTATYHYLDNLAFGLRFAGEIIVDVLPSYYDSERVARILGEDDTADSAIIDPSIKEAYEERDKPDGGKEKRYNLGVGKYDIQITVGPSYTTKRQESLEFLTQLTQANPSVGAATGDLMVKLADVPHGDEMAERIKALLPPPVQEVIKAKSSESGLPPEAMQIATEAKQVVGQMQGQLQAMQEAMQAKEQEVAKLEAQLSDKSEDTAAKLQIAQMNNEAKLEAIRMQGEIRMLEQRIADMSQLRQQEMSMQERPQVVVDSSGRSGDAMAMLAEGNQQLNQSLAMVAQAIAQMGEMQMQMAQALAQMQSKQRTIQMVGPSGNTYSATVQ